MNGGAPPWISHNNEFHYAAGILIAGLLFTTHFGLIAAGLVAWYHSKPETTYRCPQCSRVPRKGTNPCPYCGTDQVARTMTWQ